MFKLNDIQKKFRNIHRQLQPKQHRVSFPGIELELKIETGKVSSAMVHSFFTLLNKFADSLDSIEQRHEIHLYFQHRHINRTLILMQGSRDTWIKEKSPATIFTSGSTRVPILVRSEKKITPRDRRFTPLYYQTLRWPYLGSFEKNSTDISFWFKGYLFTTTFSNSDTGYAKMAQIELEYDGHRPVKTPKRKTPFLESFGAAEERVAAAF